MNYGVLHVRSVPMPQKGKIFPFIDKSDRKLKIKLSDGSIVNTDGDYTAFEVYAHDTRIEVGDLESQTHINYIGKNGDKIIFAVNPSMTEQFKIRSEQSPQYQNVIVDFGDGTFVSLKDLKPEELSGQYRYTLSHTYKNVGKYIIKIFGTTYFSFTSSGSEKTSLICRIFEQDLPIASHIWNLSSALQHNHRLLRVNMYSHKASFQITHWSGGFTSCRNLIECIGFSKYAHRESNYNMFQNCNNLTYTDLRIADCPADLSTGNAYAFTGCSKLESDINYLLPSQGFKKCLTMNVNRLFKNCIKLTGVVPSKLLWNNPDVKFVNTSQVFIGCSDEIRNQVPISWGGTASDDIIQKSLEERVSELQSRLSTSQN